MRMPSLVRSVPVILLAAVAVATAACGGSGSSSGETRLVRVDGSSTVYPISEAVAEEFQRENQNVRVTVGISGTGGGFQKFCRGETDISNASRPIRQIEMDACAKAGIEFLEVPVAYDGLTVVIHPNNTWASTLTVADLRKMWEPAAQGKITRWNHVRPEWPDRELHLFGAGVDSGTFDYFTEAIVGKEDASRGDYTSSEDDNMLVQGISGDENALGFFGYAYYEENQDKLKAVAIDGGNGPVGPSPETVRNGTYVPLSRPIFIYASLKSLERPEVKAFLDYYALHSAELVREVGYVPLSEREYALVKQRIADRPAGTMFKTHHSTSGTSLETLLGGGQ